MGKGIRRTPEQIIRKLRQAEVLSGQGKTIDQICCELGVSDATYSFAHSSILSNIYVEQNVSVSREMLRDAGKAKLISVLERSLEELKRDNKK